MKLPNFDIELGLQSQGISQIAGIDEVGRGCLAGPIVAAAVIFDNYKDLAKYGIADSKKLTPKKRAELDHIIRNETDLISISELSALEIDRIGISEANKRVFEIAVNNLAKKPDFALIDGIITKSFVIPHQSIVRGESKSISIAAASIIAKVYRDNLMVKMHDKFPEYYFNKHKGYGTRLHCEKLYEFGPCKLHRRSFLGFLNNGNRSV